MHADKNNPQQAFIIAHQFHFINITLSSSSLLIRRDNFTSRRPTVGVNARSSRSCAIEHMDFLHLCHYLKEDDYGVADSCEYG